MKPNYSTLASKAGNNMKDITTTIQNTSFDVLMSSFKSEGYFNIDSNDFNLEIRHSVCLNIFVCLKNVEFKKIFC